MSFTEPAFLFLFLPLFLLLFATANRVAGERGALAVLLIASLFISATQGPWFLLLTSTSALLNYALLLGIVRVHGANRYRGLLLTLGVVLNIGLLVLFKYAIWLRWIPVIGPAAHWLSDLIPITLSFLTFQRTVALLDGYAHPKGVAAALFDPYRGREPNPPLDGALRYISFAMMFPNMLIGPIAYLTEVMPQFHRRAFGKVRGLDVAVGFTLLSIGLFKKVVIADDLGRLLVDPTYYSLSSNQPITPLNAVFCLLGYFAQLYFDFSGYSDMVLGIARMFGVRLPFNFDSPLRASGIIDFYRRWHITLTRVIARFLFTPLSIAGTRFALRRKIKGLSAKAISLWLPLIINFTVIGLWHGPSLTFIVFGAAHGLWYVIETEVRATKRWKRFQKSSAGIVRTLMGASLTIPMLIASFALFRSPTLEVFVEVFKALDGDWVAAVAAIDRGSMIGILRRLALAYSIIYLAPNAYELLVRYRPGIRSFNVPSNTVAIFQFRWRPTILWGIFVALLDIIVLLQLSRPAPFVYGFY